jgi:hypothetical protein
MGMKTDPKRRKTTKGIPPNVFLNVMEVQLLISALEASVRQMATFKGTGLERRRIAKLIRKLYQVTW